MDTEERTFVLVKPDGVERGLLGEIISRFEKRGLKIVSLEMIWAKKSQVDKHYPQDPAWIKRLGEKTLQNYQSYGLDSQKELGTGDPENPAAGCWRDRPGPASFTSKPIDLNTGFPNYPRVRTCQNIPSE